MQGEIYTPDHPPQQVKQHSLPLLYREESTLHTETPSWPMYPVPTAAWPAGKQHRHTRIHNAIHLHRHSKTLVPPARALCTPKDTSTHGRLQANTPDAQVTSTLIHQSSEETHIWNFSSFTQAYRVTHDKSRTNGCEVHRRRLLRYCKNVCICEESDRHVVGLNRLIFLILTGIALLSFSWQI